MLRTFYDVTDSGGLSAAETKQYDASGRNGNTSYMTANTVTSSATGGNSVRELCFLEIFPPQRSDGTYEDLREVWLVLDGKTIQHYINLPGQGDILMTPPSTYVQERGGYSYLIPLGEPLWKVVNLSGANPNMPLRATAPKYSNYASVSVYSKYAVTQPFRIRLLGYEYGQTALAALASKWNPKVHVQTLARRIAANPSMPALSFTHQAAPISMSTFTQLPGGLAQPAPKVNPYWRYARNAQATDANRQFVLSNFNSLGGGTGHIEDDFQDLGLEFNLNSNALVLRGFGVKGVPLPPGQSGAPGVPGQHLGSAGWFIDGNTVPEEIGGQGFFMSQHVQTLAFGAARRGSTQFVRVPTFPGELLIYHNQAAPFIMADGTAAAADSVAVAMVGALVEQ